VLDAVRAHYGVDIEQYQPDPAAVETYVNTHGLNAFYESIELRKACCQIRKVEPLNRALAGNKAWITGQRRAQSWSEDDVWHYIRSNAVPYNTLHDRGYPSIGCEPCTRAIQPGEDIRAGRWWWEQPDQKECGLHVVTNSDGTTRLVRTSAQAN
jgi:phosphoadenosine phosphosulfate reductase